MYTIAGASGHTGSTVAEGLLGAGKAVRVIVRDAKKGERWHERGAQVAVGTLEDAAFLARALDGAEAAYLLLPPPSTAVGIRDWQLRTGDAIGRAVEQAAPGHVVQLSSIGAEQASDTGPIVGLHHLEARLAAIPSTRVTVLRASAFQENWAGVLGMAKAQGMLPCFVPPTVSYAQIATRDIGRFALAALLHPPAASELRQLAGPREYSVDDVARIVSDKLGRAVSPHLVPRDHHAAALERAGFPSELAALAAEMYEGMNSGRIKFDAAREIHRGQTTLEETLAELLRG
jgi:uncharacterized protein YbjT (DUF2867 family)